jgi:hypothetical protein
LSFNIDSSQQLPQTPEAGEGEKPTIVPNLDDKGLHYVQIFASEPDWLIAKTYGVDSAVYHRLHPQKRAVAASRVSRKRKSAPTTAAQGEGGGVEPNEGAESAEVPAKGAGRKRQCRKRNKRAPNAPQTKTAAVKSWVRVKISKRKADLQPEWQTAVGSNQRQLITHYFGLGQQLSAHGGPAATVKKESIEPSSIESGTISSQ